MPVSYRLWLCLLCAICLTSSAGRAGPGQRVIVFLGDSLTAGYGLRPEQAYPALIGERLRAEAWPYRVVNAGLSGDTTAGGLRRIDWLAKEPMDLLVVALGGNDALRGLDPAQCRANLLGILRKARENHPGVRILLAGMKSPPNMGLLYAGDFNEIYPAVAKEAEVPLVPFLLVGVAGKPSLNQDDGIHPTAAGQRIMAENVWRYLRPMLEAP